MVKRAAVPEKGTCLMWLFTPNGFFSAVAAPADGGVPTLKIRSRSRGHLEWLRSKFDIKAEIVETHDSDYQFRIFLSRQFWAEICGKLAAEIDYGNFKDAAHHGNDQKYASALHGVWSVMARTQPLPPYSAKRYFQEPELPFGHSYHDDELEGEAVEDVDTLHDTAEEVACPECGGQCFAVFEGNGDEQECEDCGHKFDLNTPEDDEVDERCPKPECRSDLTIIGEHEGKCVKCGHLWEIES